MTDAPRYVKLGFFYLTAPFGYLEGILRGIRRAGVAFARTLGGAHRELQSIHRQIKADR